jgi:hypothetical protein
MGTTMPCSPTKKHIARLILHAWAGARQAGGDARLKLHKCVVALDVDATQAAVAVVEVLHVAHRGAHDVKVDDKERLAGHLVLLALLHFLRARGEAGGWGEGIGAGTVHREGVVW